MSFRSPDSVILVAYTHSYTSVTEHVVGLVPRTLTRDNVNKQDSTYK